MTPQVHVALIIEDDPGIAGILRAIVASLGHSAIVVTNREEALAEIERRSFCYVFLDIALPESANAVPSHLTGLTLLKSDLRRAFPGRTATDKHRTQIIVVTAHSQKADFVTRIMQEGADDFVSKPFPEDLTTVADAVSRSLRHSERSDHALCAEATRAAMRASIVPPPSVRTPAVVTIHVSARASKGRYSLRVGERAATCTEGTLLRLLTFGAAAAGGAEGWIHVCDLGREHVVHKALSRLRIDFRPWLDDYAIDDLFENDPGRYRLNPRLTFTVDDALTRHASAGIRSLAMAIRSGVAPAGTKKLSAQIAKTKPRVRARSA